VFLVEDESSGFAGLDVGIPFFYQHWFVVFIQEESLDEERFTTRRTCE
jgi:hypothetical protein